MKKSCFNFTVPDTKEFYDLFIKTRNLVTPSEIMLYIPFEKCTFEVKNMDKIFEVCFVVSAHNGAHTLALYYYPCTSQYIYKCGDKAAGFDKEELEKLVSQ